MRESESPLRIDYVVCRDDYVAAMHDTTQHLLRSVKWSRAVSVLAWALLACGVVIGMGYIALAQGYIGLNRKLQWWIALAFLCAWLCAIWHQRLRTQQIFSATAADGSVMLGKQALVITPDALIHHGRGVITQVHWPALQCILEKSDNILIILNNYQFFAVPCHTFPSVDARRACITALRAHAPHIARD